MVSFALVPVSPLLRVAEISSSPRDRPLGQLIEYRSRSPDPAGIAGAVVGAAEKPSVTVSEISNARPRITTAPPAQSRGQRGVPRSSPHGGKQPASARPPRSRKNAPPVWRPAVRRARAARDAATGRGSRG